MDKQDMKLIDLFAGLIVVLGIPVFLAIDLFSDLTGRWRSAK